MKKNKEQEMAFFNRADTFNYYKSKFFNLWSAKYKWTGLEREQREFLMNRAFYRGTWCAFKQGNKEAGILAIADYSYYTITQYNYPAEGKPINMYNAAGFPDKVTFGTDAVYGFTQHDRRSLWESVQYLIRNLTDAKMVLKTNEFLQKMPMLVKCSPENEEKMRDLIRKLARDEPTLFVTELEQDTINALLTGAPYILDKLSDYCTSLESEVKTFLGIDNANPAGISIIPNSDEVNANNQEINTSRDIVLDSFKEFCEETSKVLGFTISVDSNEPAVTSMHEDAHGEKGEQDEADND